jgi:hypothetical protein
MATSKEAVKVRVSVARDSSNPQFHGAHAGGLWWPAGEAIEKVLESDEMPEHWLKDQEKRRAAGDLAGGPVTDRQGKILPIYSLEQKLAHLYVLEGRRRDEMGNWSDPGFEINDADNRTGNENRAAKPKAAILAKVIILDRRDEQGVWESERNKGSPEANGANGAKPLQPQVRK